MIFKHSSDNRLRRYWENKLRNQNDLLQRFADIGLLTTDSDRSALEIVCACSLMVDNKPIFEVLRSIELLVNESIENKFGDEFFIELRIAIDEIKVVGMRTHVRKLQKLGQKIAAMHREKVQESRWRIERERSTSAAIKDEPFLTQRG